MSYNQASNSSSQKYKRQRQKQIALSYIKEDFEIEILPVIKRSGLPVATYIKKAIEAKIIEDKKNLSALLDALSVVEETTVREVPALMKDDCEKIILYGSFARGDYTLDSDVDIAILTKSDRMAVRKFNPGIDEISSDIGIKTMMIVNYICLPLKEFEQKKSWYPFFMNIAHEGKILYDLRSGGAYA